MSKDKIKKFGDLAYEYIRKQLIKPGKGGITSLPTEKEITNEMLQMFEKLRGAGYNVTNIGKEVKNADDLGFLINRIDQAEINQAKEFSDAAEALETIQYKLNNNIPLNPDDQKKLLGSGYKTNLKSEAFQGFKPKIIEGGKKEGIEQLLQEGKITKGTAPKTKQTKPAVDPELQKSEDRKKMIEDFKKRNDMEDRAIEDFVDDAGGVDPDDPRGIDDFIKGPEPDDFDAAQGGIARVGMVKGGGLFKFLSENSPLQAYKKYLKSVKERAQKDDIGLVPEMLALSSAGILGNRALQRKLKSMDPREEEKKDKKAMGGRIGFKEGGGMTRRTFLKLLGGLASIPLVGKFLKPAAKVSKAVEAASKSAEVPSYFPKLVYKIQLLGDDITQTAATKERQIVKNYKGYELTEDLDSGSLVIKKDGYTKEEYLQYSPSGQYYDETRKKVIKYPEQYEEVTVKPDYDGKMKDVDYGLDSADDIIEEVETTDFEFLKKQKKASGGLAYMMGE